MITVIIIGSYYISSLNSYFHWYLLLFSILWVLFMFFDIYQQMLEFLYITIEIDIIFIFDSHLLIPLALKNNFLFDQLWVLFPSSNALFFLWRSYLSYFINTNDQLYERRASLCCCTWAQRWMSGRLKKIDSYFYLRRSSCSSSHKFT